jgi:hypothetical protein
MDPAAFQFEDLVGPALSNAEAPAITWRDVLIPSQYKKRTRDGDAGPVLTCVDDQIPKRACGPTPDNLFKFKSKPMFAQVFKTDAPTFPDLDSFFAS